MMIHLLKINGDLSHNLRIFGWVTPCSDPEI
jgi:hypothetical protein